MKALKLFIVACVFGMFSVACGGSGSGEAAKTDTVTTVVPETVTPDTAVVAAPDTTAAADTTKK
jgi:hypothetical protein